MKISDHLAKVERFEILRARLDPMEDFELWFWMGLSAATALINAALHATGITEENDLFATQVPDVYAEQDGNDWRPKVAFHSDLIHAGLPALETALVPTLSRAFESMAVIEHFRDPCVRGDHSITAGLVSQLSNAYDSCVAAAREAIRLSERGPV